MTRVSITYLGANGIYRRARGVIEKNFPTLVANKRDQMRHIISEQPIFLETPPVSLDSFQKLKVTEGPLPPRFASKLHMICEDNNFYPLSGMRSPDLTRRDFERHAMKETGYQYAIGKASKQNEKNGMMSMMAFAAIGCSVVMTLLIALIVILNMRDNDKGAVEISPSAVEDMVK